MRKCKGTGKAKGFGCGQEDNHYRYGLCLTKNHCFQNWLRNSEAGQEMLIKASNFGRKKVSAVRKKEESKDKRERRFELLSYPKRVQEARRVFQKWIRERDKDLPCVSCGNPFAEDYHAGHFKKAEVYSQLIFHRHNCHKQCVRCNVFLGGNEANYRVELIKRIGEEAVNELEQSIPNKVYRYSNEELKEIIKKYTLCKE